MNFPLNRESLLEVSFVLKNSDRTSLCNEFQLKRCTHVQPEPIKAGRSLFFLNDICLTGAVLQKKAIVFANFATYKSNCDKIKSIVSRAIRDQKPWDVAVRNFRSNIIF